MKLFYDMLVPYMPDKDINDKGELEVSPSREAGRNAMIDLDNFQRTGVIMHLYNAVLHACIYAEVDLITEILELPEDLEIPEVSINDAVDICAKELFKSANPDNKFDVDKFVGILLTSAHFALDAIRNNREVQAPANDSSDDGQISLDEVIKDE